MRDAKRATRAEMLDEVSDDLGVVLQRADELLAEWSAFGAAVRGQVEREAQQVGAAVAQAVEVAVGRATASGVDRAVTEQLAARLTALTGELAKLETRARNAQRLVAEERTGDRRLLWVVIAGVLVANALLAMLLLRPPAAAPAPAAVPAQLAAPVEPPVLEAAPLTVPLDAGIDAAPIDVPTAVPIDAPVAAPAATGSAAPAVRAGAAAKLPRAAPRRK